MLEDFNLALVNLPILDNVQDEGFQTEGGAFKADEVIVGVEDIKEQTVVYGFEVAVLVEGGVRILQVVHLRFGDTRRGVGEFLRLLGEH